MPELLYVSVKVNPCTGQLTEGIAGQIDRCRAHIGPIVSLAGHRRARTAIIRAGGRHLTNPNDIALNFQRDSTVSFSARNQRELPTLDLDAAASRAIGIALAESDQASPVIARLAGKA